MIAEVIIDIINQQVNRSFDYSIPEHLEKIIGVGYRVRVPFGKTIRLGFVIGIKKTTSFKKKLRDIYALVDVYPVLTHECIELAKYIAENNFSFYATALQTMIPAALKIKYQKLAIVAHPEKLSDDAKAIFTRKQLIMDSFSIDKQKIVFSEVAKGNVVLDTKLKKRKDPNETMYIFIQNPTIEPTSRQGREVLSYLEELGEPIEYEILLEDCGYSKAVIETLIKRGILSLIKKEKKLEEVVQTSRPKAFELNKYQKIAFDSVDFTSNKTYLLHGITGSGKTEVYMDWIQKVIESGKNAILLVPEISLTPQITGLFRNRFGENIAILHSRLSSVERYDEWRKIYSKSVKIVVGARSAIFAPIDNLGIIILDECHEGSYIQQNNPKYSAIEIAKLRSLKHKCPLILGSATPNVEDYYYATNAEYELLSLPIRANGKPLPEARVVDLRQELMQGNRSVFSKELQTEIKNCYERKEQSILFLNRRGFSSFVMCRNCGQAVKCPHCDVSLTYHATTQNLKCHYCGYTTPNVSKCFNCGSDKIRFVGSGTERIVEEIYRLIPEARVIRMDLDTTSKLEDYESTFFKFKNHEADILIGTQMITKGLDFNDVTLVGVINADLALSYPTFDATQTAYNLIEQVSGRAGRNTKSGKVIIQTYNPEHYVIQCAQKHDYDTYYRREIERRRLMMLPPFSTVIEIEISSLNMKLAKDESNIIIRSLKEASKESIILGPTEATIFKKQDRYHFIIQIQAVEDSVLEKIKYIYPIYQNNKNIGISITRK